MFTTRGRGLPTTVACGLACMLGLAACGEDFPNDPRPAETLVITGVITPREVTISPGSFGAGPVALTISNQTEGSHTVTLVGTSKDGTRVNETAGPINPFDAATLQYDLEEGRYEVRANSESTGPPGGIPGGETREIEPGPIVVGSPRPPGSGELQQP